MPILYRFWYIFAMTYYDDIYERAVDDYYLISSAEASEMGIPAIELVKLAKRGKLDHIGHGLYRLARYIPTAWDPYAIAVKRVGNNAFLSGESVIALLELAPTNPTRIFVATPKRVRKTLPDNLVLVKAPAESAITSYKGIPCQPVAEAIRSCIPLMMPSRLEEAVRNAYDQGFISENELTTIMEELAC